MSNQRAHAMHKHSLAYAAKLLGMGRGVFIRTLKSRALLDHQCLPMQAHVKAGYFVIEARSHTRNPNWNNGNGQIYNVCLVTDKGVRWLADQLGITIRDMDQPADPAQDAKALEQVSLAIRMLRMHIECPTAMPSNQALSAADEAMTLIEQLRQQGAA